MNNMMVYSRSQPILKKGVSKRRLPFHAVIEYCNIGRQTHTSVHHQRIENSTSFLLVSSVALFVGCYKWWFVRRQKDTQEDHK
jgi:hypothetical protein